MDYIELESGEKLKPGDEYSNNMGWKVIPPFIIGDPIPNCDGTKWRRPSQATTHAKSDCWIVSIVKSIFYRKG